MTIKCFWVITLFATLLIQTNVAQTPSGKRDVWRTITPLLSTLRQVEKILGPPMSKYDRYNVYDTPDARITISFGKIKLAQNSCIWAVSEDTVVDILMSPKKQLLLSSLGYDLAKFTKLATEDDEVWDYLSDPLGIRLETRMIDRTDSSVLFIKVVPTLEQANRNCLAKDEIGVMRRNRGHL